MKRLTFGICILSLSALTAQAQLKRTVTRTAPIKPTAAAKPLAEPDSSGIDRGAVLGHFYTNRTFGFDLTFPQTWIIPDDQYARSHRIELGLRPPVGTDPRTQTVVDSALRRLTLLLSVYKYLPEFTPNSVVRVAVEDLTAQPQIKDAVDYIDAVRQSYAGSKLPAEVQFSATEAERLGNHQFAFIDLTTREGKTRMYARVHNRFAILFKITYEDDNDLQTFRDVLANGNFLPK